MRFALGRWIVAACVLAACWSPAPVRAQSAQPNVPLTVEQPDDPDAAAERAAPVTGDTTDQSQRPPSPSQGEGRGEGETQRRADSPDSASSPDSSPEPPSENEQLPLGHGANLPGAGPGPGAGAPANTNNINTERPGWILQTLTALGVVLALIFMLRMVLRRIAGPAVPNSRGGLVEVLARTSIGSKTYVLFLRINDRVVVAAQSPTGIDTLTTLDEPEDVARILAHVSASQPASITSGFRKLLQRADGGYDDADAAAEEGGDEEEQYVDRTRDQLSGLMNRIRKLGARARGGDGE